MMWILFACSQGVVSTEDIAEIRVEPSEVVLNTRPTQTAEQAFAAYATLKNGDEIYLDLVSWEISNLSAGFISSDGVFTSVESNGGVTNVVAKHFGEEGSAKLTVVYNDDIVTEDLDVGVVEAFANASASEDTGLRIEYPYDDVTVPRNLEGLGFLWNDPSADASTVYRIRFQSGITDISVYVTGNSWVSNKELWEMIAASNRDGLVEVYIEAASWNGSSLGSVRRGEAISLVVNRLDARGSVLYWAADTAAIMRLPIGETEASFFWRNPPPGSTCVGCHSISEQMESLVVTHDGSNGRFSVIDISEPDDLGISVDTNDFNRMTFKTVSPDGQFIFGTNGNQASLFNISNGVRIKNWQFDDLVAHPDWSPDGNQIVMVHSTGDARSDMEFNGGEIVQYDFDVENLEISNAQVLKSRDDTFNYYYPAYSPDGNWIAYNRASNDAPRYSYAAIDAEVWLMSRDGSIDIRLNNANGEPNMQNSYPRWGPLPDDDVLWLAYSSRRPYPLEGPTAPQIWLVGIDPALAEQGLDPSSSPFWLPGQVAQSDNHLPVWWSK